MCSQKSLRASSKDKKNLIFSSIILFYFFDEGHDRDWAGWSPSQFAQWAAEGQLSDKSSLDKRLANVAGPLQLYMYKALTLKTSMGIGNIWSGTNITIGDFDVFW